MPIELASVAQKDFAVKQYRAGLELFDSGQFQKALELFETSLAKVDSPNSRLMVARCYEKLERYPEAYHEFLRVFEEASSLARSVKKYESTRDAAKADLDNVKTKVAVVHLTTDGQATLNGAPLSNPERPLIILPPGEAAFSLTLANGEKVETKLQLAAGDDKTLALELPPPAAVAAAPAAPPPPVVVTREDPDSVSTKTLGFIGLGVGGAGALGFVAFGLLDRGKFEELQDGCANSVCSPSQKQTAEDGRFYQAAANVSLGVGVVGLVTGTILLLSGSSGDASAEVGSQASTSFGATDVKVGLREIVVEGRF